jgi:multicomponent Na+:H+ antiporter subunit B
MPLKHSVILRTVARGMIPLIVLFAFYLQIHGERSAGGGFQAGVLMAAAFMLYALVFGLADMLEIFPLHWQKIGACAGVMIYAGVGLLGLVLGGRFLDYDAFGRTGPEGQLIGIFLVELGIGTTVFSVILMLFCLFAERKR